MTIGIRYNNFDVYRPNLCFGVQWDTSNSDPVACLTRIGDAVGLEVDTSSAATATYSVYTSDFDNYLPWSGMRRVELNHNGDYVSAHGEVDGAGNSTFNESTTGSNLIMVEIPKFWYSILRNTPTEGVWQYWISPFPIDGYTLHPAFLRGQSGTTANILDYIYVGAYDSYIDPRLNAAYPNLDSVANVTPSTGQTRATFRSYASNTGLNCTIAGQTNVYDFGLLDWQTWNALELLYLIEYASLNSMLPSQSTAQGGLSAGITNDTAVEKTGWTSSIDVNANSLHSYDLGNSSGQVRCNTVSSNPVYAMSYRGIENLWGNVHTMLDAININTDRTIWVNFTGSDVTDQVITGTPYATGTLGANYSTSGTSYASTGLASTIVTTNVQIQVAASITFQNNTTPWGGSHADGVNIAIYRTLASGSAPAAGSPPGTYDSLIWQGTFYPPSTNTNETVAPTFTDIDLSVGSSYSYYVCISAVDGTAKVMSGSTLELINVAGIMEWPYVQTTYSAATASGNPMYPTGWASYQDDNWQFEKYQMGGTLTSYMCAAYVVGNYSAPRFPRVSGCYNSGLGSGIFSEDVTFGYSSTDAATGTRLQYIRPPISYYKY